MLKFLLPILLLLYPIESQECGFTYGVNYAFSGSATIFAANSLELAKSSCIVDDTCIGFHKHNSGAGYNVMEAGTWKVYPGYEGWKKECPVTVRPDCSYEYVNNYAFSGSDIIFSASTLSSAKAYCSLDDECVGFHKSVSGAGYAVMHSGAWKVYTQFEGWRKHCINSTEGETAQCATDICDIEDKIDWIYDAVTNPSVNGFADNNLMDFDVNNNKKITFSFTYFELIVLVFVIVLSMALVGLVGFAAFCAFQKHLKNRDFEYSKVQSDTEMQMQ